MQNNPDKKLWFKRKRWSWGWRPVTWEGWVIMLGYLGILWGAVLQARAGSHSTSDFLIKYAISFIPVTLVLIYICYKKGENPWKK
jgi:hypothetical protein